MSLSIRTPGRAPPCALLSLTACSDSTAPIAALDGMWITEAMVLGAAGSGFSITTGG